MMEVRIYPASGHGWLLGVAEQQWKWLLEVRAGSVGLVVAWSLFDASSRPALTLVVDRLLLTLV